MRALAVLLAVVLLAAAPRPAPVIPADSLGSVIPRVGVEPDQERTGAPELSVQPSTVTPTRSAGAPLHKARAGRSAGIAVPELSKGHTVPTAKGRGLLGGNRSAAGQHALPIPPARVTGAPLIALGQGALTTGVASWYADPRKPQGSLYAAMPGYRKPFWVTVRYGSRSLRVRVSDACQCHVGRRDAKVIDLSWRAFVVLTRLPLSRGIARVEVSR